MNCKEVRQIIDGYLDGELDLVHSTDLEAHLEDCGSCHRAAEAGRALSRSIRAVPLRYDAPRGLEKRVLAAVRKESASSDPAQRPASPRRTRAFALAFGAAAVALIAFIGWYALRLGGASVAQDLLAQEALSSHLRSLQANHLFDVASTDQHTVKPWFTGKLDYSPPVVDLADRGFPLTGGRLDYLRRRPVAALVYRRRLHVINLFVWPDSPGAEGMQASPGQESIRGYHTICWSRNGMTFYAVSDVNAADLREFARLLVEQSGT